MADEVENATAERALAELKPADEDVEMKDAPADQDADAEGEEDEDAEGEIDADGESDAEGEIDADGEPDNTALPAAAPEKLDQKTTDRLFDLVLFMQDYKEDDREIAGPFHKIVNRRLLPEYYEVIKEAVAFSTIRNRLTRKMYKSKAEFVRDCALIFHNAQVYNRPGSLIFKDAGHLREVYNTELQKLVDEGILIAQEAVLPDLGGLPSPEPTPPPEEKKEADEEDDDEEDEEDEDSEDERPKRGGRRKPRPSRGAKAEQDEEEDGHRKRGRPPKVLTPMEARIQALLKGVRRFKDDDGELQIRHFEKLPDSKAHPEYYEVVKTPVALDTIKKRAKRKKYKNLDEALQDMEVMFENAKKVNAEGTGVYNDAVELQKQARIITDQEKNKPDDDFRDEHGKLPLSAVEHKGETWKVGDWVHIVNPNDPSKPTVAQIYRIWQDANKQRWINACWYFHPYQTVHHVDKRFFENEVVKTGQYRDHMVQEIVDRCFVMFITRYNKGRPRGLPVDKTVYVCEARYNEDNCRFNKIKTWASCLPDEVREKDYEMDLFDMPRKLKKNPSPIKHLLNAEAKETDPLPRATYRRNEAPPLIGAVHKRPRDPNESPPPSPTSTPEPVAALVVDKESVRRPPPMQATPGRPDSMYHPPQGLPGQSPSMGYAGQYGAPPRQMQTPVPVPVPVPVSPAPQHAQHAQAPPATAPYQMHQPPPPQTPGQNPFPPPQHAQPHPHYQQQQPQPQHTLQQFAPTSPAVHHPGQHPHQVPYQQQPHMQPHYQPQQQQQQAFAAMSPAPQHRQPIAAAPQVHHTPSQHHPSLLPPAHGNAYYPPGEVEVYTLGPQTDALVPEHIKKHFQRDENGNIIFFTKPPLERNHKGISAEHARLGHSARYLADYAREKKEAIVRKMESTDQGTKDNDDERWGATAPAVKPAGGSDATLPSTALQQNDATGPPAIPRSVLAALDPKFEDFERLEKLVRAKCGDHAFDAFSDWIVSMQDSTDMVNESLGNWREVKERDTAEKQQQKAAAAPQTTKPKKAWLIKHEREEAVRLKKEAGKQADLQNSIRWSADLAHYLKNKRLAAAKLASE